MLPTSLAMVLLLQGTPAVASEQQYKIEGRVLSTEGELLGAPSVAAVAHEPARVTLPANHGRVLDFWVLVKPVKDGKCDKVMVKVAIRAPDARDEPRMVLTSDAWKTCGDEVRSFAKNGLAISVQVQRERS